MTDEDIDFDFDIVGDEDGSEDTGNEDDNVDDTGNKKKTLSIEEFKKLPPEEQFKLNQKLYNRAKKAETDLKDIKTTGLPAKKSPSAITPKPKQGAETTEQRVARLELVEEKRQAGFELGLSPSETDQAFKYFGGKPTKEDLKNPFFQAGLAELRKRDRLANNTPRPQNRNFNQTGKKLSELSPKEKEENFQNKMGGRKLR